MNGCHVTYAEAYLGVQSKDFCVCHQPLRSSSGFQCCVPGQSLSRVQLEDNNHDSTMSASGNFRRGGKPKKGRKAFNLQKMFSILYTLSSEHSV